MTDCNPAHYDDWSERYSTAPS